MERFSKYYPLIVLLLLALVWSVELTAVQCLTINERPMLLEDIGRKRWLMDFSIILGLLCLLPRFFIYGLFFLNLIFNLVVLSYFDYFRKPLSFAAIKAQSSDLLNTISFDLSWVNLNYLAVFFVILVLKLFLYSRINFSKIKFSRFKLGFSALCIYCGIFSVISLKSDRYTLLKLSKFDDYRLVARKYGYFPVWLADGLLRKDDSLLKEALETAKISSDKLTPLEVGLELPEKVVILQVESLDYAVLGHKTDTGQEVTPNLNRILDESMFYKVKAIHFNGSADADFVTLNSCMPSPSVVNYRIKGFPMDNILSKELQKAGYSMSILHSMGGGFFNMRGAIENADPDINLIFSEDYINDFGCTENKKFGILDKDSFRVSSELLKKPGQEVQLLITLTSHIPFHYLPEEWGKLIPDEKGMKDAYLNSINYTDYYLGKYLEDIPEGTLLFIYGDHESTLKNAYFPNHTDDDEEYVPFIVYQKGKNLAKIQNTRDSQLSKTGELTFLDTSNYIRNQFKLAEN